MLDVRGNASLEKTKFLGQGRPAKSVWPETILSFWMGWWHFLNPGIFVVAPPFFAPGILCFGPQTLCSIWNIAYFGVFLGVPYLKAPAFIRRQCWVFCRDVRFNPQDRDSYLKEQQKFYALPKHGKKPILSRTSLFDQGLANMALLKKRNIRQMDEVGRLFQSYLADDLKLCKNITTALGQTCAVEASSQEAFLDWAKACCPGFDIEFFWPLPCQGIRLPLGQGGLSVKVPPASLTLMRPTKLMLLGQASKQVFVGATSLQVRFLTLVSPSKVRFTKKQVGWEGLDQSPPAAKMFLYIEAYPKKTKKIWKRFLKTQTRPSNSFSSGGGRGFKTRPDSALKKHHLNRGRPTLV